MWAAIIEAMAASGGAVGGQSPSEAIPSGTDGSAYGFPGYVSDGTQWVQK